MSSPATIPPELLSYINGILVDELEQWKADKDAGDSGRMDKRQRQKMPRHPLLTATRVNKHWNAVATRDLYTSLYLHKLEVIRPLYKTLCAKPEYLDYCMRVTIDFKYVGLPTQHKARQKELGRRQRTSAITWPFLKMLKPGRLRHLSVECQSLLPYSDGVSHENIVIPALDGLKSLAIHLTNPWSGGHIVQIAQWITAAAPSLERLMLPSTLHGEHFAALQDIESLRKLKSFGLDSVGGHGSSDMPEVTFKKLTTGSACGFEDISLPTMRHIEIPTVLKFLERAAPTLRRLHLSLTSAIYSGQGSGFARGAGTNNWPELFSGLLALLPKLATLEVLQLEMHFDEVEEYQRLIRVLPPNIRVLKIGRRKAWGACTSIEGLTNTIADELPHLGRLSRVQVINNVQAKDYTPTDELDSVSKFEERGVELTFRGVFTEHLPWVW